MRDLRSFCVHYAGMETEDQPGTGYPVNLRTTYCPYRYHLKMGCCYYLLLAQQSQNVVDEAGDEILVNRKRRTKVGRP